MDVGTDVDFIPTHDTCITDAARSKSNHLSLFYFTRAGGFMLASVQQRSVARIHAYENSGILQFAVENFKPALLHFKNNCLQMYFCQGVDSQRGTTTRINANPIRKFRGSHGEKCLCVHF